MKKYNSNIKLGTATLNVVNFERQLKFYTEATGMTIISKNETEATLGTSDNTPLLHLKKVDGPLVRSYGLYHIAYLVPDEQSLANILRHFIDSNIHLDGGSDHGYSNALYLSDIEGNGIEVYYDKDESTWDIKEDGRIIGVTEPIDATHLLDISETVIPYSLPVGTIIGHVHLSVQNSTVSSNFYQEALGFSDKFTVASASWIAYGNYHHHLAVNHWGGPNLSPRQKGTPGLDHFEILFIDDAAYNKVVENIKNNNTKIISEYDNKIIINDPNGIEIHLIKEV